jgi:hypothetical protein
MRKVWYIYKGGYNVGMRNTRHGARCACEIEAGRIMDLKPGSRARQDIYEKDRIRIDAVEARLEELK